MPLANRSIKQQFEGILKDAKILCELEPFVKKWSLEEVLPNFEAITESDNLSETSIANILQNASQSLESNPEKGERTLRKIKGNNSNYLIKVFSNADSHTCPQLKIESSPKMPLHLQIPYWFKLLFISAQ